MKSNQAGRIIGISIQVISLGALYLGIRYFNIFGGNGEKEIAEVIIPLITFYIGLRVARKTFRSKK